MKICHSGVICPKTQTLRGQTGTSLIAGYRSRDTLQRDTVVVQGPGSFQYVVNFSVRKVAEFSDFNLFSPYKTRKRTSGDQPTSQGLHRRMIPIFPCGSRWSKGVSSGSGVFLWLLVGELSTPRLAQIFAYSNMTAIRHFEF